MDITDSPNDVSYYTSCFLTSVMPAKTTTTSGDRSSPHTNDHFLRSDNHLAFHQVIDPTQFGTADRQKLRFARAMRTLGLQPHFHISELDRLLTPSNKDNGFWEMCEHPIAGCPTPGPTTKPDSKHYLRDKYIRSKSEGKPI
jgi:hypothetical protein